MQYFKNFQKLTKLLVQLLICKSFEEKRLGEWVFQSSLVGVSQANLYLSQDSLFQDSLQFECHSSALSFCTLPCQLALEVLKYHLAKISMVYFELFCQLSHLIFQNFNCGILPLNDNIVALNGIASQFIW